MNLEFMAEMLVQLSTCWDFVKLAQENMESTKQNMDLQYKVCDNHNRDDWRFNQQELKSQPTKAVKFPIIYIDC